MSRVIKFRFFCPKNGKMPYQDDCGVKLTGNDLVEEEDWKVMQFTGLCDKNGKEIYDGDILLDSSDERCQAFWCDQTAQWQTSCSESKTCSVFETVETLAEVAPDGVIIGNIYQNPELLQTP